MEVGGGGGGSRSSRGHSRHARGANYLSGPHFTPRMSATTTYVLRTDVTIGLLTNRMLFDSIRRISNSNMSRLFSLELTYEYEPRDKFDSNSHAF